MPTQAPPDSDLGFPAKGSLKRVPFAFLVRDIARARTTGNLYLLAGETKKVVSFVDGHPTVVRSNLPSEFLGQILTDQGLITQEQCDNTLEAIRRTGKKQGELLVEMGILSEGNLRYGLDEQVRSKLFEIFAWDEGRFQFKVGGEPGVPGGPPIDMPIEALIVAGVQERWTDERARAALKALAERYPAVHARWTGDLAPLDLLPEEQYFIRCLDGSRTVDELLARKYDPEVPQVSTLLFGLIAAGVVEASEAKLARRLPPPRPNLTPSPPPDDALTPKFEQLSAITEYEDTPLPNKLPGAGVSSSRNPRLPALPTEDEEMFRGLNGDESIVADSRILRASLERSQAAAATPALDVESDFGDLDGDDDGETDFSDLVRTSQLAPGAEPVLPQPPLGRAARPDSGKSPAPTAPAPLGARPDSSKSPSPLAPRPDSSKSPSPLGLRPDSSKSPAPTGPAPLEALKPAPTLGRPGLAAPLAPAPTTPRPAPAPLAPPAPDPLDDLEADPDLGDDLDADLDADLGDLDDEIEMLDDEEMLGDEDDDALADEALADAGLVADAGLGDELGDGDDSHAGLGDELGEADDPLAAAGEDDEDPLADASGIDPGESGQLDALPGEDEDGDFGEDDGPPPLGEGDQDDLLGDLDGELDDDLALEGEGDLPELEDLDLDADLDADLDPDADLDADADFDADAALGSNEDTDGGYRVGDAVDSAEALGATRFAQGEEAMRDGDYDQAVALFEDAYANGVDLAELHAHLAFARYRASNGDAATGTHGLELLDWAEQADPGLPMIHAYRGAILVGLGRQAEADESFDRALYLDPGNELALAYRSE